MSVLKLKQNGAWVPISVGAQGKKGDPGDTGDTGPANTLTIGTVTSGIEASATITGDAPNQVLNLVLQQGEKGDSGVYVGTGDMPEGYNVQIDPSGSGDEIVTAENIQSALGYTPADSADLADKLPKSPTDWEAWTAEEQAAARERIGCYNGFTVLMDEEISEEANNIYFELPNNASEFIAYFESYNTAAPYDGSMYLRFDNKDNVNPISKIYSYFGSNLSAGRINIKGIQKCVIINDEDVCVEYAAVSINTAATNESSARNGRVGIAKRTSNKISFHFTGQSYPIGMRFLVLVRCK